MLVFHEFYLFKPPCKKYDAVLQKKRRARQSRVEKIKPASLTRITKPFSGNSSNNFNVWDTASLTFIKNGLFSTIYRTILMEKYKPFQKNLQKQCSSIYENSMLCKNI